MDNVNWPEGIPYSDLNWSVEGQDNTVRFEPERGPSKVRKTATRTYETINIRLTLTMAQVRAFRYWYKYDLNEGVKTFWYPDFLDNDDVLKTARFKGRPTYQRQNFYTTVSAVVEIL